jgi:hypothetical protein
MVVPRFDRQCNWDDFCGALIGGGGRSPAGFTDLAAALAYLRGLLGEDYCEKANEICAHPFLGLAVVSWPGVRQEFFDWIGYVRSLEEALNVRRVLHDLRLASRAIHAYTLLGIAGRLRQQGLAVSFEPETETRDFRFRPDVQIQTASPAESFFLELSCQAQTHRQLNAFEAMAACEAPVKEHFEKLRCSFRLDRIPAPEHMEELVAEIRAAVQTVYATGHLVEVLEDGVLSMGICRRDNGHELEQWRAENGIGFDGYKGPVDSVDEVEELKRKIRSKQKQLPVGHANLLCIQNNHIFSHYPDVSELALDLQEELFKWGNVGFLLVQGCNGSGRNETAEATSYGKHRFERRVEDQQVRHILLLLNRYADVSPSAQTVNLVEQSFFT